MIAIEMGTIAQGLEDLTGKKINLKKNKFKKK